MSALRRVKPELPFVKIELEKRVPVGAGLGGGSSDAAATLKALNALFELGFSASELADIGATLGSDVPFFFSTGSAEVRGRGEIISDINLPLNYTIVLAIPSERVSTAAAYRLLGRPKADLPVSSLHSTSVT